MLCLVISGSAGTGTTLHAQEEIHKEIVVVKPYQPSLSDAFKINVQPHISDSIPIHPSFDYSIHPKKFETRFQVRPIGAARMVGTPLTKLYKSYLKLGFGNYLAPLAELNINSLRDKSRQWGIAVHHYSINGKLKLDNEDKVHPGYFENSLDLYGKKILKKTYLSGRIGGAYDGANFYGYHPSFTDTLLQKEDIRQNWIKLDGKFRMGSMHKDSLHLNWTGCLDYLYTRDHYDDFEHAVIFRAEGNERFRSGITYGANLGGEYYFTPEALDSSNNLIVRLNPWFGKTTSEFTYRLGFGLDFDAHSSATRPHFYPEALLQINLVKGILIPYFGVDGRLQVNNFRTVAEENPYITPGLDVENTMHKIRGYAGLRGSFSKNISYELDASYSLVDHMPFYINDTNNLLGNTFLVVYDNLERIRLRGELQYRQSDRLRTLFSVRWDRYRMEALEQPWHMPGLMITAEGEYNLHNKILLNVGVYYTGKRYAAPGPLDTETITLDGFADLNLGIEYRYTKILSGFIRLNNLLGSRIYTWNQYPGMGFNLLFGFTYAL